MRYSIVIPARNEEAYIFETLQSIAEQTVQPEELIVVDDNSTDKTAEIVQGFTKKYSFIKIISSGNSSSSHQPGSKIINAFYKGFEALQKDWDLISKLDADLILPTDYFEKVIQCFQNHPGTGMAGGQINIKEGENWVYEKITKKDHIRGALKTYSKSCFEKTGGPRRSIGWDTADELLALYHGFEVRVLTELKVKLLKPTGTAYKDIHGQKIGESFYRLDYGFVISLIAALKAGVQKKSIKLLFDILKAYWKSKKSADNKIVTKDEGRFIREYRWNGIMKKLKFLK